LGRNRAESARSWNACPFSRHRVRPAVCARVELEGSERRFPVGLRLIPPVRAQRLDSVKSSRPIAS
jgi:hypothetical protein